MITTKTKIAGVKLDSYICNASGPLDESYDELEIIAESRSSAIMMKSCTILPREWNQEPRYADLPMGSVQSMWLPNLWYKEYIKFASKLKKYNKPIIASISGLCTDDYIEMVKAFQNSAVDLIEVNLSCPNIEWKPQVWYDFEQTENVLEKISNLWKKPIWLKLPPYHDMIHFKIMANLIEKYNINFITCINSIGNSLIINPETESTIIKPKNGLWWLCWEYIKPIALANVRIFYELLKGKISIFWVWWITNWIDAFEFLLAWADAVQIATIFKKEWPKCFERIDNELKQFMNKKSYNSIDEVKWRLKYI